MTRILSRATATTSTRFTRNQPRPPSTARRTTTNGDVATPRQPMKQRKRQSGFTLIELIVVVTIIGLLAAVAISNVKWAQQKARESALRHDLFEMRKSIDDYYADKQKYPESLQALASEHYLRGVPKDPITGKADWEEVQ